MAILTLTLTIGDATREITVNADDLTLGLAEDLEQAQESGKIRDLIPVVGGMLGLSRDETRALTMQQWNQILGAMRNAATVPNASG